MRAALLLLAVLAYAGAASAQVWPPLPPRPQAPPPAAEGARRLSGPRVGLTVLNQALIDDINEAFSTTTCTYDPATDRETCRRDDLFSGPPVITQFGWQIENRLFQTESGLTVLAEGIGLVGGAERNLFLPSLTALVGARTPGGFEAGIGPNLSLSGVAYAVTAGKTFEVARANLPVNLAVVLSPGGPRASLLVGFNASDRRY